jgi:hypothetical protein
MKYVLSLACACALGASLVALAEPQAGQKARAGNEASAAAFLVQPYLQLPTPSGMTVMWETDRVLPSRVEFGEGETLDHAAEGKQPGRLHEVRLTGLRPATACRYRVRSGDLVSDVRSFKTAPPPGTRRWRMALYGDSRSNPRMHAKVAEQIARAHVDLILHTGDIVANGKDHDSWRQQFFQPLGKVAGSVPWVSTIGNHERDSENYFSYMALPGNERYFGFDYANAHIVCIDSNTWVGRGRDSDQYRWMQSHFREKRPATWTFVAFHHPLFSAHATRPINPLRWDWAPLLLDPASHVDAVFTGHDHFFARNYRMGPVGERPQQGVLCLTSAGGGASLYPIKERDYVASDRKVHHFTLLEFDGDRVNLSAIDTDGKVFDRYTLTKEPTPPEDYCALEIEQLRQDLRQKLAAARALRMSRGVTKLDSTLRVPTTFRVPVSGQLRWQRVDGWKQKKPVVDFQLKPGEPLVIPLQAEVAPGRYARTPRLTISFAAGRFRNRTVDVFPWKLAGPQDVGVSPVQTPPQIDGRLSEDCWSMDRGTPLLGLPPRGGLADRVRFVADEKWLYVGAQLDASGKPVEVEAADAEGAFSRTVLNSEHVRVVVFDGKDVRTFALAPSQARYCQCGRADDTDTTWRGVAGPAEQGWQAEIAIPRKLLPDLNKVRVNVVHQVGTRRAAAFYELSPGYALGINADVIPDWQPSDKVERLARLRLP